ncbi:hypothetical protein PIB30_085298 [Stylosanthes scabra]|uniref:Uncharacterized protein n=1 Tax=Stylosanthes scabra TaxID=79078 RepID=A0ABU6VWF9_9FABA|nr:hypothetical protein [Stylosanthes scabra]
MEKKGTTNDSVKFQQIQKVLTMPYPPTIMGSNNKAYMITEDLRSTLTLDNLNQLVRDYRLNTHSKEPPSNRAFKVKKRTPKEQEELIGEDVIEIKKRLHNNP